MAKTQKKIGQCQLCKETIIVDIDDDFLCNRWSCFAQNIFHDKKQKKNYDIQGLEKLRDYEK